MKASELITKIEGGALAAYANIYSDLADQTERYTGVLREFISLYGDREACLFSVPGRTEVQGNHTDHNHGCVLAAAIDRDIIAVASPTDDGIIRVKSEGYPEDTVVLSECDDAKNFADFSSASLIAGTVGGFKKWGYQTGSFVAYTANRVLKGSGLSSSAAFEVMIGNIMNYLFNGGEINNEEIAKIAQFAENEYFGKPCGLMDQMACAVGGFVHIDFADPKNPVIDPIAFSLTDAGFVLCILNTGGNHADLNEDYASVPAEMKRVANYFGKEVLRGITEQDLIANAPVLRKTVGDRALLRAIHFVRENERVGVTASYLKAGNVEGFLQTVLASGDSSYKYLQNVYTVKNVEEQGLSLALSLAESLLAGRGCAYRVHGGGFAGTTQAFVRRELAEDYKTVTESVFGEGACMMLSIRPLGAIEIKL
ncbi:MAG: galactokinase [Ruminococcaceae bacterium]|nr:galactokinase [Oscillospiraceae bacterium]